jgi:hypothetical protein
MTRYLSHPQALKQAAICYQTTVWHPAQGEMVVNIAMHCDSTLQAIREIQRQLGSVTVGRLEPTPF